VNRSRLLRRPCSRSETRGRTSCSQRSTSAASRRERFTLSTGRWSTCHMSSSSPGRELERRTPQRCTCRHRPLSRRSGPTLPSSAPTRQRSLAVAKRRLRALGGQARRVSPLARLHRRRRKASRRASVTAACILRSTRRPTPSRGSLSCSHWPSQRSTTARLEQRTLDQRAPRRDRFVSSGSSRLQSARRARSLFYDRPLVVPEWRWQSADRRPPVTSPPTHAGTVRATLAWPARSHVVGSRCAGRPCRAAVGHASARSNDDQATNDGSLLGRNIFLPLLLHRAGVG
jgi:hypothetical protein